MSKATISKGRLQHLKKVLAVQEIYMEHSGKGYSATSIFRNHIQDNFFISLRTFWRYLGINAKREIRLLEEKQEIIQAAANQ